MSKEERIAAARSEYVRAVDRVRESNSTILLHLTKIADEAIAQAGNAYQTAVDAAGGLWFSGTCTKCGLAQLDAPLMHTGCSPIDPKTLSAGWRPGWPVQPPDARHVHRPVGN